MRQTDIATTDWSKVPARDRKMIVGSVYVHRDLGNAIRAQIDENRESAPLFPEPHCILLTGESGSGKSSLLKSYLAANPPSRIDGVLRQPVLLLELPVKANMLGAATVMLRALNDPGSEIGTLEKKSERVRIQLKLQKVEVVFVDEFQHIVESSGERTLNKVGDWLKQQAKMTGIPFVLSGLPNSSVIVDVNAQFARICPYRYHLGPFKWDDQANRKAFRLFLAEVDKQLPFDMLTRLADVDLAQKLHLASEGSVGRLMLLIRKAAMCAIDRGAACVEMEDLAFAFDRILAPLSPLDENPFWTEAS
ncbi:conserved protein of unknown function(containing P-loop containing nucleoside triphosphate hydrolases domain,14-296) [Magnetospirillum sp. XM-1]|uniref:TniB family NTP-binding protein n=1 Tax=Magnetospirillum sp. XM-1 TaxID=1663591 RepID=UPI00073E0390|nr:TniB family NTP-binding protein [Magnetospirillum sp. XM-1]CUW40084.1 conserved protein of unknown function(containing P-loop containing nucleoside triphosphate hydrolases domain,14-296) [Magnetospirillum sp. XM-1]